MTLVLVCLATLVAFGTGALFAGRDAQKAHALGTLGALVGAAAGLLPAAQSLLSGEVVLARFDWGGFGTFVLGLDPLTALFLLPILLLPAIASVYGSEYLGDGGGKSLGAHWFFFDVLVASMAGVVLSRDALSFLVAWEAMALSSFFLVTYDAERASVREAGWVYLIATHLGTAFLVPFFLILGERAGSLEFEAFSATARTLPLGLAGVLFVFAVVGFGTKAGFMPMHVWLPEAHPAAPSHVSAVMSGVMIKTGIYGVVRALSFLPEPAPWWGWLVLAVGAVSAVGGVLFAAAQHDLKRMLAYSSVENVGLVAVGLGLGLVGRAANLPALAALGFAGALLHVLNHALFKGLLFLGAGAVLHGAGTVEMDRLGGLLKRMPVAGLTFALGAAAICGLPPLNGFLGEALLYVGAFAASSSLQPVPSLAGVAAIAALALTGGLAAAAFSKAFGVTFLGEPRSEAPLSAHEPGPRMRGAMLALAGLCVALGLAGPLLVPVVASAVAAIPAAGRSAARELVAPRAWMASVTLGALAIWVVGLSLAAIRRRLLLGREVGAAGTWDCGYAAPTARMQYTASSYADPVVRVFFPFLRTRHSLRAPKGYFPRAASFETETPDFGRDRVFEPAFAVTRTLLSRLSFLQQGGMHRYVMFIALTLLVLLVWKL